MKLSDSEREEFLALAQDTYDPELCTEDDLPALRAARRKFEEEQQAEQQTAMRDDEDEGDPDEEFDDD